MRSLHMIEIRPDMKSLMQFLHVQGLDNGSADEDVGYGIHAWLGAAFDNWAPRPWRLFLDRRRPTRILGYSPHSVEELRERISDFAEPSAFAACSDPEGMILGKRMPAWRSGQKLGFELQCCPVGRKSKSGVEKDLFLIKADGVNGDPQLDRESIYSEWAKARLERDGAATVTAIELAGFRLVRQTRQTDRTTGPRRKRQIVRPQALLRGQITVNNPNAFTEVLARGIGRHKAFGYGMVLLRPPS